MPTRSCAKRSRTSNRVAIARVVIRTKEYIAAVKPIDGALVLEFMHWASEIVDPATLELPEREKLPEAEMKMAKMLIDTMSVDAFEPEKFTNRYHDEVLAMIEARANGKELPKAKKRPARQGRQPHGRARTESGRKQEAARFVERRTASQDKPAAKRRKKTAA